MAFIRYCPICRDVSLSDTCRKCHEQVVRIEGSLGQFRQVLQALANNQKDWFIILENMQRTPCPPNDENLTEQSSLPDQ